MIQVTQVCTSDTSVLIIAYSYHITQKVYRIFKKTLKFTLFQPLEFLLSLLIYLKEI